LSQLHLQRPLVGTVTRDDFVTKVEL